MDPLFARLQKLLEGQYALERELGRGGMATVYLATDLRHGRSVAIKLLQPELTTAVTAERFLREINITAKLQHPHILPLLDSGARDGLAYYAMPHVEGESLRERLIWERQLPIDRAVLIAREVASALEYAHEHGVIHRDIKPENILLSAGHAVVADFGIARAVKEVGQRSITQVGLPLGTPAYMSPEQAAGRDDIDHRSDLYGLGCVLFEMLSGRPPFVAGSVSKVIHAHLTQPPPRVCEHCSGAPAELDAVLLKALAKEPGERYQSAREFVAALEFVGAVETLERRAAPAERRRITPPQVLPDDYGRTPFGLKQLLIVAGLVGAVVLALFGIDALRAPDTASAPAPGELAEATPGPSFLSTVGVKPLQAIGGDSAARVLSAGLTEEITTLLSRFRQLRVISRTSMEAVSQKEWTSRTMADSLGLRYLLEGSVQRSGSELAVTLQLIDATSDTHVWSDSYTMPLRNILMLRREIAAKVGSALAGEVRGLRAMAPDSGSGNPLAVEALARGLDLSNRADEDDLVEAIAALEQALELDPTYARAAAELSNVLRMYVDFGFGQQREPYETLRQSVLWGRRAVELDSGLAHAWAARGAARADAGVRAIDALTDFDRAVALAPASGEIRVFRGIGLARAGRYDDALRELDVAASLDPLNASLRGGGVALTALGARRYDRAAREALLAAARDPGFPGWSVIAAIAHLLEGDLDRCLERAAVGLGAPVRAICRHRGGQTAEATATADSVTIQIAAGQGTIYAYTLMGAYHAELGEVSTALSWLERGFAASPTALDFRFLDAGLFDQVRDDPAFRRGLETIMARVRARTRIPAR